jgi:hypothetical protein
MNLLFLKLCLEAVLSPTTTDNIMKWSEIRKQYPDKFVLIGDIVEKKLSKTKSKILEGHILEISDDGKEIFKAYRRYKKKGMNVLFSLPKTKSEFIVEDVPPGNLK